MAAGIGEYCSVVRDVNLADLEPWDADIGIGEARG